MTTLGAGKLTRRLRALSLLLQDPCQQLTTLAPRNHMPQAPTLTCIDPPPHKHN